MDIQIITKKVAKKDLAVIAQATFGDMVKGVVDLKKKIMALGGELHADCEAVLLEQGSKQEDLWGFNIYTDKSKSDRLAYTSLINVRPSQGNRSMEIQAPALRKKIKTIVDALTE